MARISSAVRGLVSSYALLGASVVYGLATVPLALSHLSKAEFGLWSMVMQFVAYLTMLDLGMSGSIGRFIVDYKDDATPGRYASLISTGSLILCFQGAAILTTGYVIAPWFAAISHLPDSYASTFITLFRVQCLIAAIGFPARIFTHVLYAHQRLDAVNLAQITVFLGGILVMWLGFVQGAGVYSILWSSWFGLIASTALTMYSVHSLRLLPTGKMAGFGFGQAREMFKYGSDVFLVAAGTQMMTASQPVILSRAFGLDTVATWTVGTRIFGLMNQLVWKLSDISAPGFAEMIVRGEKTQLELRYRQVAIVSASIAGWAAVTIAQTNSTFISIWTKGAVAWSTSNDIWLGIWMISLSVTHCHNGFILVTKQIKGMRWIYFLEGFAFVSIALVASPFSTDGISLLLKLAIAGSIFISTSYGIFRAARYFVVPVKEVAVSWLLPMAKVVAIYGSTSIILFGVTAVMEPWYRLLIHGTFALTFGLAAFTAFGMPQQLRGEIFRRLCAFSLDLRARIAR